MSERAIAATASLNGTCGRLAATGRIRSPPDASGANDLCVRKSRKTPSEGVTAILAHGAINRSVGQPLAESLVELSTLEPWWLMW